MNQSRQLAAIMFTDIVGYTAMMQQDEKKALAVLKTNLGIHRSAIEEYGGKIIKELGDGMLASFPTVTNCLHAAIRIQNLCNETNEYKLSIGIHQGEVVFEKGDVFGDAVNVASRIQTLGIPGSILFSKKISEEITNKAEFKISPLGSFEFKNVAEPIEVYALANEGFPIANRNKITGKLKKRKQAVPILWLALIGIAGLLVYKTFLSSADTKDKRKTSTSNAMAYAWYAKAEYRITPENKEDLDSAIFFLKKAIEADSSFALAHAQLARAYAVKNYFIDPKGGYSEKAFVEVEKALYLNPELPEGIFVRTYLSWNFQNKFPHEITIRQYKKVIELNPEMDEAYHQLGVVYMHVGLIEEAIQAINKALELNPNNKFTAVDLASTYNWSATNSDSEHMIDLFKMTPDHLISPFRTSQWASALITLGRTEEAKDFLSHAIIKDTTNLFINSTIAILLAKTGDRKAALHKIEFCEKSNLNTGHFHHAVYNLAVAYALMGENEKAVTKIRWVIENGFPNYVFIGNDPLIKSLHSYEPFQLLLKQLETSHRKFQQTANE